jgi:hypothetical protein
MYKRAFDLRSSANDVILEEGKVADHLRDS